MTSGPFSSPDAEVPAEAAGEAAAQRPVAGMGLAWLRTAQDRDFGREGIPMVLALTRVGPGTMPIVADQARLADGTRIAAALELVRTDLFPSQRDADLGCLITTLQAASALLAAPDDDVIMSSGNSAPLGYSGHRAAIAAGRFIRVVNYHNTPLGTADSLRTDLAALVDRYAVVSRGELDGFYETGRWASDRPGFIPVFYEGYRNNADVAGPVCDELGLSAWFFICTGFVSCPAAEQEGFARSHQIDLVPAEHGRDRVAISWDEIGELSRRHTVTPHTSSHDGIADVVTDEDLEREILAPKRLMDGYTGQDSPAMAWLWGTPYGGSPRHDQAITAAGYRYVFSNTMIQRLD